MKWVKQEPGWWTSEAGGVVLEADAKWWAYPVGSTLKYGPYVSISEAKSRCVKEYQRVLPA